MPRRKSGMGRPTRGMRLLTPMAQARLRAVKREDEVRSERSVPSRKHAVAKGFMGKRDEIQHSRSIRPRR